MIFANATVAEYMTARNTFRSVEELQANGTLQIAVGLHRLKKSNEHYHTKLYIGLQLLRRYVVNIERNIHRSGITRVYAN